MAQEKILEIAARVRELRELSEVSVQEMMDLLQVSESTYLNYESGVEDIPASVLYEIAVRLHVDMGVLLTGEAPRMHIFTVTRKDKGVSVERGRAYRYQNLAANFIHKKAETFLVTVEPKPDGTPCVPNAHPGQEFVYMLEGQLRLRIHHNEIVLEEGDSVFFDSNYAHAMEAFGGRAARFLAIVL